MYKEEEVGGACARRREKEIHCFWQKDQSRKKKMKGYQIEKKRMRNNLLRVSERKREKRRKRDWGGREIKKKSASTHDSEGSEPEKKVVQGSDLWRIGKKKGRQVW